MLKKLRNLLVHDLSGEDEKLVIRYLKFISPQLPIFLTSQLLTNTNALSKVSLRGVKRRSNLAVISEIATLPLVARNDNVTAFNTFVLSVVNYK